MHAKTLSAGQNGGEVLLAPASLSVDESTSITRTQGPSEGDRGSSAPRASQRSGRWSADEQLLFLHGLKVFGKGRWKKIRTFLPFRSLIQIKSHAQKVMKRVEAGDDIFAPYTANICQVEALLVKAQQAALLDPTSIKVVPSKVPIAVNSAVRIDDELMRKKHLTAHAPMKLVLSCATKDDRFRFTVGDCKERNVTKHATIYRTTLGSNSKLGSGFTFAFLPTTSQNESKEDSVINCCRSDSMISSATATTTDTEGYKPSAICVTPLRTKGKGEDEMAAEVLCGLSGLAAAAAKRSEVDQREYLPSYLVSP